MSAEKIAEVLATHQWYDASSSEADDPAVGCTGCDDWFGDEDALDNGVFAAHQAAALEPVIREAQAAAVRDSARYIERLAPKGLVSRDAVLADLEVAAGRIGRGRYANGTDPNPYDTKEEA